MKNNALFTLFSLCFLWAFLSLTTLKANSSFISNPIILSNWQNGMSFGLDDFSNGPCVEIPQSQPTLDIVLSVRVGVPDITPYPNMYLIYSLGDDDTHITGMIGPLQNSDFVPVTLAGGETIYSADSLVSIDVSQECGLSTEFVYNVTYGLYTDNGGGGLVLHPYPAGNYQEDLFPESIFQEVSDPSFTPFYSGTKSLCCVKNILLPEEDNSNAYWSQSQLSAPEGNNSNSTPHNVRIAPNPFFRNLILAYESEQTEDIQITVFSTKGEKVFSDRIRYQPPGILQRELNLGFLPAGVYYYQMEIDGKRIVRKLIKTDE